MKTLGQVAEEAFGSNVSRVHGGSYFVSEETWNAVAQAAIQEYERRQWRDISEAPKDGTHILAYLNGWPSASVVFWVSDGKQMGTGNPGWTTGVIDNYGSFYSEFPTHFRPLPAPPEAE